VFDLEKLSRPLLEAIQQYAREEAASGKSNPALNLTMQFSHRTPPPPPPQVAWSRRGGRRTRRRRRADEADEVATRKAAATKKSDSRNAASEIVL